MHATPPSPTLPALASNSVTTGVFGVVLLAIVSRAQTGPATKTLAAFSNPLPAKLAAATEDK